jgi:hypothetical protein
LLSLFLLIWFISASITRYEVMYPIYLLGLVMALRGVSLKKTGRPIAVGLSTALVLAQIAAIAVYFGEHGEPPARFDRVVAMIPSGSRIFSNSEDVAGLRSERPTSYSALPRV